MHFDNSSYRTRPTFLNAPVMPKNYSNICKGSTLGKYHRVERILGEGGFTFVTKCHNTKTNREVAVKVKKTNRNTLGEVMVEVNILKELQHLDPDRWNIVRYNCYFLHENNICISFELLDQSLCAYIRDRYNEPLTVVEATPIVHQMATALSHLKSLGIVHADLKPDNIMVVDRRQQPLKVKLIDFSLAHKSGAKPGGIVQTICYSAPEVMLGLPFHGAIDMWGLGVTAAELVVGSQLYPGYNRYDMLSYIVQTQGQLPDDMLDRGANTEYYFDKMSNGSQKWRLKPEEDFHFKDERKHCLTSLDGLQEFMKQTKGRQPGQHWYKDLVKRMMQLDPDVRIQPCEVLQHPIFSNDVFLTVSESSRASNEMDTNEAESRTVEPQKQCGHQTVEETRVPEITRTLRDADVQPKKANGGSWFGITCNFIRKLFLVYCVFSSFDSFYRV